MKKFVSGLIVVCLALIALAPAALAAQTATEPAASNPLAGTNWELVSYGAPGAETPAVPGHDVTLQFADDSTLSGNGGCNVYNGTYSVNGDALTVSALISTKRACIDAPATQQETTYLGLLQAAKSYAIDGGTLTITTADGQQLTFRSTPALVGPQWQVIALGAGDKPAAVVEGSAITLTLTSTGQALGNGGCNTYSAAYTLDGDKLTFSNVASTKMACADAAVTQQESVYFQILQSVTRYELNGNTLILWTDDNQQIVLSSPVLAGSAWQLQWYGGDYAPTQVLPNTNVTLTFPNETDIAGSGGCNGFGGNYQIAGSKIIISQVISTMMACLDTGVMEQEQAYFAALQAAISYKIDGNTLTIDYDKGKLTFTRISAPDATPEATAVSS